MTARLLISFILMVFLSSCGHLFDNNGFPREVKMDKEGGSVTISGDEYLDIVEIRDLDTEFSVSVRPQKNATSLNFQWLNINIPSWGDVLIITAEPNIGKKRKLEISGMAGNCVTHITVIQI